MLLSGVANAGAGQFPPRMSDQLKLTSSDVSFDRSIDQRDQHGLSQENITFFPVLADVESLQFVLLADTKSHHGVENLQEYHCSHDTDEHRCANADCLVDDLSCVAFDQSLCLIG